MTLCKPCHDRLHKRKNAQQHSFNLKLKATNTKHATEISIVAAQLRKGDWEFDETFGFVTKIDRMEQGFPKRHFIDASVIASRGLDIRPLKRTSIRRCVSKGDYQQTKGPSSEKSMPTGKLFGLRKFDLVKTTKGTGFIKGMRSTGYFSIGDIHGNPICNSVKVKAGCTRITARTTTLAYVEKFRF